MAYFVPLGISKISFKCRSIIVVDHVTQFMSPVQPPLGHYRQYNASCHKSEIVPDRSMQVTNVLSVLKCINLTLFCFVFFNKIRIKVRQFV